MLILSILLNLLICTTADAITLPGYTGQCPVLEIGSTSKQCVTALQLLLNKEGIRPLLAVNGIYNTLTKDNVATFQKSRGLKPQDGIVGPETASALKAAWQNSQAKNRK